MNRVLVGTLIVAAAGSKAGLLDGGAFSAIVAAVLLTTMFTPPLLRFAFARLRPMPAMPLVDAVETNKEDVK